MRIPLTAALLVVTAAACSASPASSEAVDATSDFVAAGQVFNFGAIAHPESCMDVRAGGTVDGTQIQEWACNGSGSQSFALVDAGGGAFAIVNTQANKCVDVAGRSTANGTKVQLFDCNGTSAQSFFVRDAGGGFVSFVNTNSGKCLDVYAGAPNDGTVVQLFDCNGTNAQRWNPTVIGSAPPIGSSGGSSSGGSSGSTSGGGSTSSSGGSSSGGSTSGSTSGGTTAPNPDGTRTFAFANHCGYDVWLGGEGNPIAPARACNQGCPSGSVCNTANQLCTYVVPTANWQLAKGASTSVTLPASWGGRFWPRTECTTANGRTTCATGDCGGNLECPVGVGGAPPATLAEFTVMPASAGTDFYDVSNVDGSNVPLSIVPTPGTFDPAPPPGANVPYYCASPGSPSSQGELAGCKWDLDASCPSELVDHDPGHYVGCRSANQVCAVDPSSPTLACAQNDDLYGCVPGGPNAVSGSCYSAGAPSSCCGCPSWSPSGACQSSNGAWTNGPAGRYAKVFKDACPTAYSFPYDDPTSTFTCKGSNAGNPGYTITFCP